MIDKLKASFEVFAKRINLIANRYHQTWSNGSETEKYSRLLSEILCDAIKFVRDHNIPLLQFLNGDDPFNNRIAIDNSGPDAKCIFLGYDFLNVGIENIVEFRSPNNYSSGFGKLNLDQFVSVDENGIHNVLCGKDLDLLLDLYSSTCLKTLIRIDGNLPSRPLIRLGR